MKRNKTDSDGEYNSNHFIYGTQRFEVSLMILFNGMFVHGFSSSEFLKEKSLNNSDNYNGIGLGNITGKLMDIMTMNCSRNIFKTCDLQVGFKKGHSTMQCTFVVNEVIQYYRN